MILDKLIEKKDIYAFVIARKKDIATCKKQVIKECEPKERARLYERYKGMITQLEQIEFLLRNNILNDYSKRVWKK